METTDLILSRAEALICFAVISCAVCTVVALTWWALS